jgi:predicted protein tyrosine phosphatase
MLLAVMHCIAGVTRSLKAMRAAAAQRASEAEQRAAVSQSLHTLAVSLKQYLGALTRARNRNTAACAARTSMLLALIDR